jgi:hypothetical protein
VRLSLGGLIPTAAKVGLEDIARFAV